MTTKSEGNHDGEFIVSEANGYRSRDAVTVHVPAGETYSPGLVLGKVTSSGKYVGRSEGAGTGEQTAKGVLFDECDNSASGSAADFAATIVNGDAEVLGPSCDANGGTEATVLSELLTLGIKVRGDLTNVAT